MPEFTQSWAFWFLVVVISFAAGFVLAIIIAGSSKGSRMEERSTFKSDDEFYNHIAKFKNYWKPEIEIVTQNNPKTD